MQINLFNGTNTFCLLSRLALRELPNIAGSQRRHRLRYTSAVHFAVYMKSFVLHTNRRVVNANRWAAATGPVQP